MADIDYDALVASRKALIIAFIIGILIENAFLIYKFLRFGGAIYKPKSLMLISLAIGDMFLAIFPLVIMAMIYYENYDNLNCTNVRTTVVYSSYLIHFVYGVGLILLAVELIYRYKRQPSVTKSSANIVKSIISSAIPWLLGVLIILPLTLADTEENPSYDRYSLMSSSCFRYVTKKRVLAMYGVAVILPACLALVVSITIMCIRLGSAQFTTQAITYQGGTQGVIIATSSTNNNTQQYPPPLTASAPAPVYNTYTDPQNAKNGYEHQPQLYPAQYYPPTAQYPTQQYAPPQYAPPQYPVQNYPPAQYPIQQQTNQSNVIVTSPVLSPQPLNTPAVFQDPGKEKNVILSVTIVYIICVLPLTIFRMGTVSRYLITDIDVVVNDALFWLSLLRSVITPIIWMGCTKA